MRKRIVLSITTGKFLALLFLVILLSSCALPAGGRRSSSNLAEEPTPIPTTAAATKPTYTVERGRVTRELRFSGRVAPVVEQALAFPMDGVVKTVSVRRGDSVETGDLIAELDSRALEDELALAQTALDIAETRLENTKSELRRDRRRAELAVAIAQLDLDHARAKAGENPTPDQQYQLDRLALQLEQAKVDLDELSADVDPSLQADVQQAELRVAELESLIDKARLVAAFPGQITSLNISPGMAVAAQAPVGVLADMSNLEVSARLRDGQMEELEEGMPAALTLENKPGKIFSGHIRRLPYPFGSGGGNADIADSDPTTRISFDNPEAAASFSPGDRVEVHVVVAEEDDVLWLPPAAIRDFSGRKFVVVQDGDIRQRVDVILGTEGTGRVEIVEGLSEGQIVVGP